MSNTNTPFSRLFVLFVVLPLLFIAGVQLFILSEQTDYYFAWTINLPLTAAFMGAGYWSALIAAYMSLRQKATVWIRITGPTSVAATSLLGIATFLHLDKFHLNSSAPLTQFVTWVWIIVYIITPFIFAWMWITHGRQADDSVGANPLPAWIRTAYMLHAVFTLLAGIILFLLPAAIIPFWPWTLTPLTARAIGSWLTAYGLACTAVYRENDLPNTMGTRASLMTFCVLQFIALARYFSSVDWAKPLAWIYLLVLLIGVAAPAANLWGEYASTKRATSRVA
jgi:hypothetical protein